MSETHTRHGEFCRVAENLYRYTSSGVYFARFRANGKEISRSGWWSIENRILRGYVICFEIPSQIDPNGLDARVTASGNSGAWGSN